VGVPVPTPGGRPRAGRSTRVRPTPPVRAALGGGELAAAHELGASAISALAHLLPHGGPTGVLDATAEVASRVVPHTPLGTGVGLPCTVMNCGDITYRRYDALSAVCGSAQRCLCRTHTPLPRLCARTLAAGRAACRIAPIIRSLRQRHVAASVAVSPVHIRHMTQSTVRSSVAASVALT
jgi:hypothetical protein